MNISENKKRKIRRGKELVEDNMTGSAKKKQRRNKKGGNFSADKTSSPAIQSVKWCTMILISSIIQSNQVTRDAKAS